MFELRLREGFHLHPVYVVYGLQLRGHYQAPKRGVPSQAVRRPREQVHLLLHQMRAGTKIRFSSSPQQALNRETRYELEKHLGNPILYNPQ